jgi:hypothetical protein
MTAFNAHIKGVVICISECGNRAGRALQLGCIVFPVVGSGGLCIIRYLRVGVMQDARRVSAHNMHEGVPVLPARPTVYFKIVTMCDAWRIVAVEIMLAGQLTLVFS